MNRGPKFPNSNAKGAGIKSYGGPGGIGRDALQREPMARALHKSQTRSPINENYSQDNKSMKNLSNQAKVAAINVPVKSDKNNRNTELKSKQPMGKNEDMTSTQRTHRQQMDSEQAKNQV